MNAHVMQPAARAYVATNAPPDADMTKPPAPDTITKLPPEPMRPATVAPAIDPRCKCGVTLGRSGKCPALCEPVPQPAPEYVGPKVVGRTHLGKLAAPVYRADLGWIGSKL